MIGEKSGKLVVIERYDGSHWNCKCECGNYKIVRTSDIKRSHVKSCGCSFNGKPKKNTHGNRLYNIWYNMKRRCLKPDNKDYKNYGSRGITICDEWLADFLNFYNWAINNGYQENLTIERIDVNGNYEPNNCTWVTIQEQLNNQRRNKKIKYNGEDLTLTQWCRKFNLTYSTIRRRLKTMTFEEAITTPIDIKKRNKLYKGGN